MAKAAKSKTDTKIRIGVGGWTFEPWRGTFYPDGLTQKRELEYASRHLTWIEINGTYYGSQKRDSFKKWHDETPDGFIFSMKGTRFSTNRRVLAEAGNSVGRFLGSGVAELKDRLGPVNWQFHPSKKFDAADMGAFMALLPQEIEGQSLRHVVEVRNDSFSTPEFIELARQHGVAIVYATGNSYVQIPDRTANFVYARLTITDEKVKGGFTDATIEKWAEAARAWAAGDLPKGMTAIGPAPKIKTPPTDVFIYIIGGHKERNPAAAQALIEKLA